MFQFESTVDGRSVFNRESILLMKEISDIVLATPGYADVCQLAYDGEGENATSLGCVFPVSPLNYFFPTVTRHANGTVANVTYDGRGPDLVTDIDAVVRSFDADRRGKGYFLDGGFDPKTLHNRMTRMKYPVGSPLRGFADDSKDEEKQQNKVGKLWLNAVEKALFERFGMKAGFLSSPYLGEFILIFVWAIRMTWFFVYRHTERERHRGEMVRRVHPKAGLADGHQLRSRVGVRVDPVRLGVHGLQHGQRVHRVAGHV